MKNAVRKILNNTPFYSAAKGVYQNILKNKIRLGLLSTDAIYLEPRKPSGDFRSQYGQDYYLHKYGLLKTGGFFGNRLE